jgi:hypothetical protein
MDNRVKLEDSTIHLSQPKSILVKKGAIRKANTFGPSSINSSFEKSKKKRVTFVDRSANTKLCTVFNYEQVDFVEEVRTEKTSSCACLIF